MHDGTPNPNAYGNRRGTKASAFSPTLRMEITDERFREYEAAGMTIEDADERLTSLFRNVSLAKKVEFTAESVTIIETGEVLTNFRSGIAAIFELDNVVYLKLDTGDVVAVELYRVQ